MTCTKLDDEKSSFVEIPGFHIKFSLSWLKLKAFNRLCKSLRILFIKRKVSAWFTKPGRSFLTFFLGNVFGNAIPLPDKLHSFKSIIFPFRRWVATSLLNIMLCLYHTPSAIFRRFHRYFWMFAASLNGEVSKLFVSILILRVLAEIHSTVCPCGRAKTKIYLSPGSHYANTNKYWLSNMDYCDRKVWIRLARLHHICQFLTISCHDDEPWRPPGAFHLLLLIWFRSTIGHEMSSFSRK